MESLTNATKWLLVAALLCPTVLNAMLVDEKQKAQPSHTPSQLIVKFKLDIRLKIERTQGKLLTTGIDAVDALHQRYQVEDQRPLLVTTGVRSLANPLRNVYLLSAEEEMDLEAMAHDYQQLDVVEYAHADGYVELYSTPDDPLFHQQWALNNTGQGFYCVVRIDGCENDTLAICYGTPGADIGWLDVFENPPDNTSTVVVAIVDSGVDLDHPDLIDKIWNNVLEMAGTKGVDDDHNGYIDDIQGWDFFGDTIPSVEDNDPTDGYGHGTHCAGIVAATINNTIGVCGVVPDVKIMAIKCGFGRLMTLSALAQGIVYAADNGADVITMSWGIRYPIPVVEDALIYASSLGIVLVAAAGNDGEEIINYPASYPLAISVAATDADDSGAYFSTFNEFVELSAPGLSILSLRADTLDPYSGGLCPETKVHIIADDYYLMSGTSMSSPHVAAAAAYLRSVSPGLTVEATREILDSTAADLHTPGWDKHTGHGRVDLPTALQEAPGIRALIESPDQFGVVSGTIDVMGSADGDDFEYYVLEFGAGGDPSSWTEIESSLAQVTEDTLAVWNTSGLQGLYTIRLRVGEHNHATLRVFVTAAAIAHIAQPASGDTVYGFIDVMGTALCADFAYSVFEYGLGDPPASWSLVDTITTLVYDDKLLNWGAMGLASGLYSLKLSIYSVSGLEASDMTTCVVQSPFEWITALNGEASWTANYGDFDGDALNEVVVGTAVDIEFFNMDGTQKTVGIPPFPPDDYRISVAVGDLDDDDIDDIVAIGGSGTLYGFSSEAGPFQATLDDPSVMLFFLPGGEDLTSRVSLKDINRDGRDEIHYWTGHGGYSRYYYIYRPDGSKWGHKFPPPKKYRRCFPADIDGDGIGEIYCYSDRLVQFDTLGQPVDTVILEMGGRTFWLRDFSAVDIDNDSKSELIVHGTFSGDPHVDVNFWIYAFDEDLSLKEGWPHDMGIDNFFTPTHPVFADLDNDGLLEYMTTYYDLSNSYLYVWRLDGSPFLNTAGSDGFFATAPNPATFSMPVVIDADGNDAPDIILAADRDMFASYPVERILGYRTDAEFLERFPLPVTPDGSSYSSRYHVPVVGDLNRDGFVDLLYASNDRKVVFTNFANSSYDSILTPVPMWRYNRRLNATSDVSADIDADGIPNGLDNCPLIPNPDQADADGDSVGDVCDVCPDVPDPGQEDTDGDGIGDACCCVDRGNADGEGAINVADLTYLVDFLFFGGDTPPCPEEGNVDAGGGINVADVTHLVEYLFFSGLPPTACP